MRTLSSFPVLPTSLVPQRALALGSIALLHLAFFYALSLGLLREINMPLPAIMTAILLTTPDAAPTPPSPNLKPISPPTVPLMLPLPLTQIDLATPVASVISPASVHESAPAPTMPAAPTLAPPVIQAKLISGVEYLQEPKPEYPPASRRKGEQGMVQMRVFINERGVAERIEIIKSSESPRLDEAARQAVLRALFKPYLENGRPTAVFAIIPIRFHLG